MNKIWAALPYIMLAGLIVLLCYACINGGEHKLGMNITLEDGLLEWATVTIFGICGLLGIVGAIINRKTLSRRQIIFLVIFSALCLAGVGEELDWGKRIFGFDVPQGMESHSDSTIRFGHDSTSVHNLKFEKWGVKFSLSGLLGIPVVIVLGLHGILLPVLVKKKNPAALKFVEKTGVFIPPLHLGILVTLATLGFYIARKSPPIYRKSPVPDLIEANEFKETFITFTYACILVSVFFREKTPAKTAVKIIALVLTAGLLALCVTTM